MSYPTVSITLTDTRDYWSTIYAAQRTLKTLNHLNITKIYWFSDIPCPVKFGIPTQWIKIPKISNFTFYHWFHVSSLICLKMLPSCMNEDFNIFVHDDGYAINKSAWTDEFFDFDYIGAVVPENHGWLHSNINKVGNGGFSMRSKKLHNAIKDIDPPILPEDYHRIKNTEMVEEAQKIWYWLPEDYLLSVIYHKKLTEEYGVKFAPENLADQWSIEQNFNSSWLGKSLGFHGKTTGVHHHYNEVLISDRKKFNLI